MKPEAEFVRALAAGNREEVTQCLDRGRPDVQSIRRLADQHQVSALCGWQAQRIGLADKPPSLEVSKPLWEGLHLAYLHQRMRNEALVNDLLVLHEALADKSVEALVLKGPWLALHACPDPGIRPINDIDLCVDEHQHNEAIAALRAAGWKWRGTGALPGSAREALEHTHYRQQLRFFAHGRRPVELHFRLVNLGPPRSRECWVWQSARELRVRDALIRVPGAEAMLLHLLLHANQHAFAYLRMLYDLRWALRADRSSLDFELLIAQIEQLGCAAACYHSFKLANELAAVRVPREALEALRPSALRQAVFSRLWSLPAVRRLEAPYRRMELESPLFYLLELGQVNEKCRYIKQLVAKAGGLRPALRRLRNRN